MDFETGLCFRAVPKDLEISLGIIFGVSSDQDPRQRSFCSDLQNEFVIVLFQTQLVRPVYRC